MKKLIKRKRVKVLNKGFIGPLMVAGPIESGILLTIEQIRALVMQGYRVVEVLDNGTEIPLSAINYDKELGDAEHPGIKQRYEAVYGTGYRNDKQVETVHASVGSSSALADALLDSTRRVNKNITRDIKNNVPANKTQVPACESYKHQKSKKADDIEEK